MPSKGLLPGGASHAAASATSIPTHWLLDGDSRRFVRDPEPASDHEHASHARDRQNPPMRAPRREKDIRNCRCMVCRLGCDMIWSPPLFQRNDFVTSADDCRNKYVARQIIRRLATEVKLSVFGFEEDAWSEQSEKVRADQPSKSKLLCPAPAVSGQAAFPLWCDGFQTGNILVDDDENVMGVIDWEFTCAAPAQFCLDPPWWLLIDMPEVWVLGLERFSDRFSGSLPVWLEALEEVEKGIELDAHHLKQPWSVYMRQSWETGRFWLSYAMRKGWAFDSIYWKFLNERFFGERPKHIAKEEYWKPRIDLLTESERAGMELFVERKMNESEERILVDEWDEGEVERRFSVVIFDE